MLTHRDATKALLLPMALLLHAGSTPAQVACGSVLIEDTVLSRDLACTGDGLQIGANGVTLDCNGHALIGSGGGFGTAAVHVSGVSDATITRCKVTGFNQTVRANDAPGLRIVDNTILDNLSGISCAGCAGAVIEGNRLYRQFTQINLTESPDARIADNEFSVSPLGGSAIVLRHSPRSSISGNLGPDGGASILLDQCEGCRVTDNNFVGRATVSLFWSNRCEIARNVLARGETTSGSAGGFIVLHGSSDSLVEGNRIDGGPGIYLLALDFGGPAGGSGTGGCDRNTIKDNHVSDSTYGLLLFGGSDNRVTGNVIERAGIGLVVDGYFDPGSGFVAPTDRNVVSDNSIAGAEFGILTWRISGNSFTRNTITGAWLGVLAGAPGLADPAPNEYVDNTIAGNRFFGLFVYGGSPLIMGNEFSGNGSAEPAPVSLEPFLSLVGDLRGGVALLPMAGDALTTLDDGDPGNDLLTSPTIGGPGGKNVFSDNVGVDIYALDTRAANTPTLERDNQFKGHETLRIRQDWFGLVRVEDSHGDPVAGADVEIRDRTGALAGRFSTGPAGVAPSSADPDRSQGLSPNEEGGPVAAWPRFTEFLVDGRGRRHDLTPHSIAVDAVGRTGCGVYAWDGVPGKTSGSQSPDGRYEVAVVRLGTSCATLAFPGMSPR